METARLVDGAFTWFLARLLPHAAPFFIVFAVVSAAGGSFVVWFLALAIAMIKNKRKDIRFLILFTLNAFASTVLVNCFLKNLFMRTRPYLFWRISSPVCPNDFSFPSGHAAFAFGAATMLAAYDRKRRFWYFGIAFLVSYSRMYLFCHYFFDVLSGGILGIMISLLFLRFYRHPERARRPKKQVRRKK